MKALELIRTKVSVVLGILLLIVLFSVTFRAGGGPGFLRDNVAAPVASLPGDAMVTLEVADTDRERIRGLSGRDTLPVGTGLLFVYEEPKMAGIWMKDMNFPIDIIWLDEGFRIVGLEKQVQPASYPTVFYPESPALYTVEVQSGFIEEHGFQMGDTFPIDF